MYGRRRGRGGEVTPALTHAPTLTSLSHSPAGPLDATSPVTPTSTDPPTVAMVAVTVHGRTSDDEGEKEEEEEEERDDSIGLPSDVTVGAANLKAVGGTGVWELRAVEKRAVVSVAL